MHPRHAPRHIYLFYNTLCRVPFPAGQTAAQEASSRLLPIVTHLNADKAVSYANAIWKRCRMATWANCFATHAHPTTYGVSPPSRTNSVLPCVNTNTWTIATGFSRSRPEGTEELRRRLQPPSKSSPPFGSEATSCARHRVLFLAVQPQAPPDQDRAIPRAPAARRRCSRARPSRSGAPSGRPRTASWER